MSKSVTVSKIEIQIGKKTISLSPAELRDLRDTLDDLFPDKKAPLVIRERWPDPTFPYHTRPYWQYGWSTTDTNTDSTASTTNPYGAGDTSRLHRTILTMTKTG